MSIRINLGKLYRYSRIVIILYILLIVISLEFYPIEYYGYEYYGHIVLLSMIVIFRQILGRLRFCGVYDSLYYNLKHEINWNLEVKNGLIEHIYYYFGDSIFEYEIDYERIGLYRRCGYNEYEDKRNQIGSTVQSYRMYLLKECSSTEYDDLKLDRNRHLIYSLIFVLIFLVICYKICF